MPDGLVISWIVAARAGGATRATVMKAPSRIAGTRRGKSGASASLLFQRLEIAGGGRLRPQIFLRDRLHLARP